MQKYLALGDSYTIGEGVLPQASFPYILVHELAQLGYEYNQPDVIAKTGWTTDELQEAINDTKPHANYDLVSLLIGVNNQYRQYPLPQYQAEFASLLSQSITFAQGRKEKVFVLSIPDWGQTPFAQQSDRQIDIIAQEIDAYNAIAADYCKSEGVQFIDITGYTRNLAQYQAPLVSDGLHYATEMHTEWVKAILSSPLTFG
ncbi:MAG: SGNH/GDSL hydrolase family protein [Pedobacter sp.]|nr:MAG: SGNH/GDSL hydrolase family protein [Pedobacter sp.]